MVRIWIIYTILSEEVFFRTLGWKQFVRWKTICPDANPDKVFVHGQIICPNPVTCSVSLFCQLLSRKAHRAWPYIIWNTEVRTVSRILLMQKEPKVFRRCFHARTYSLLVNTGAPQDTEKLHFTEAMNWITNTQQWSGKSTRPPISTKDFSGHVRAGSQLCWGCDRSWWMT